MSASRTCLPTLLLSLLVTAACAGGDDADGGDGAAAAGDTYTVPAGEAAVIAGVVNFEGSAPAPETIDMSEEPVCAQKHSGGDATRRPVVVNGNGTLSNVFVYVKEGLGEHRFAAPADPAVMDQDGCMYAPHVLGVQTGQGVVFHNSDGILHNINVQAQSNRSFNISQPTTMDSPARTFSRQEIMIPVRCDVHGWMESYIGVVDHPYFAVTGADGSFRLENLPPGDYTIEAWHERYGTQTAQVTVAAQQTGEATFTFNANMTGAVVPLGAPLDPHDHGRVAAASSRGAH